MKKDNKLLNSGLQQEIEQRKVATEQKIKDAVEKIKKGNGTLSVSNIAKVAGISRPTIYSHKGFIENLTPLKISKTNEVKKLDEDVKNLKSENQKLKAENKELKLNNSKLIDNMVAMREYIKDKGI